MKDELNEASADFEKRLSQAMQRVDAPETLAKFLVAATEVKQDRVLPWRERRHKLAWSLTRANAWMGGAIAAALVVGVFAGDQVHVRRQREALETRQFETATRITDKALEHTRQQLQRAGVPLE